MIYKNKLPEIKNILKLFFKFIANISKNNGINTEKSIYNLVNIKNLNDIKSENDLEKIVKNIDYSKTE